jgi:hypothetical protein
MASFLSDAVTKVTTALTSANVPWTSEPGAARPNSVLVELPSFSTFAKAIGDVSITVRVLGSPPGNTATNKWILDTVETICASPIAVVGGRPSTADYGNQQLPAYDLEVKVGTNR